MADVTLTIEGMSCRHCVMRVKKAVDEVDGVLSSAVEIGSAKVSYDENKTNVDAIKDAIAVAGYAITTR